MFSASKSVIKGSSLDETNREPLQSIGKHFQVHKVEDILVQLQKISSGEKMEEMKDLIPRWTFQEANLTGCEELWRYFGKEKGITINCQPLR